MHQHYQLRRGVSGAEAGQFHQASGFPVSCFLAIAIDPWQKLHLVSSRLHEDKAQATGN